MKSINLHKIPAKALKCSFWCCLALFSGLVHANEFEYSLQKDNQGNELKIGKINDSSPKNEIGLYQDVANVSDLASLWLLSSLHYYRLTEIGTVGMRVNHAKRYGRNAKQYQIEAYPLLFNSNSGSLVLGYADSKQTLFSTLQYKVDGYFNLPNQYEVSIGQGWQKYSQFSNQTISQYTGMLGKYIQNNYIWFRTTYFTPTSSTFFEIGNKYTFQNINTYLSLKISGGTLPDIGDLPPLDVMIEIKQKGIYLDGQYPLSNMLFLNGGVGYTKQVFPSMLKREISDMFLGLTWRF